MLEDADSDEQGKEQRQRYRPGVQAERKSSLHVFAGKISRLTSQGSILLSDLLTKAGTLKPSGAHVFTVPYFCGRKTVVRARPDGCGGIEHLTKPDYHGNPIDANGSLVVTEWGDELCDFILRVSGMTTTIFNFFDPRFGLEGEFLDVFISRKCFRSELIVNAPGPKERFLAVVMTSSNSGTASLK
jgi:hypothetical protein